MYGNTPFEGPYTHVNLGVPEGLQAFAHACVVLCLRLGKEASAGGSLG